jgi:hypothetical protein
MLLRADGGSGWDDWGRVFFQVGVEIVAGDSVEEFFFFEVDSDVGGV